MSDGNATILTQEKLFGGRTRVKLYVGTSQTFSLLTTIEKVQNLIERSCLEEWLRRGIIRRHFSALGNVLLTLVNYCNI